MLPCHARRKHWGILGTSWSAPTIRHLESGVTLATRGSISPQPCDELVQSNSNRKVPNPVRKQKKSIPNGHHIEPRGGCGPIEAERWIGTNLHNERRARDEQAMPSWPDKNTAYSCGMINKSRGDLRRMPTTAD